MLSANYYETKVWDLTNYSLIQSFAVQCSFDVYFCGIREYDEKHILIAGKNEINIINIVGWNVDETIHISSSKNDEDNKILNEERKNLMLLGGNKGILFLLNKRTKKYYQINISPRNEFFISVIKVDDNNYVTASFEDNMKIWTFGVINNNIQNIKHI